MIRVLTIVALLTTLCSVAASDLCGPADARVCLESQTQASVTGLELVPGTAIVFTVPGLKTSSSNTLFGDPSEPYRFDLHGSVADDQNGVWSEAEPLAEDALGYTGIRFVLLEGSLQNVAITIEGIRICQRVIDGPGPIDVGIAFWASAFKRLPDTPSLKMSSPGFDLCEANTAPVPNLEQTSAIRVANPLDVAVAVGFEDTVTRLEPGYERTFAITEDNALAPFTSSLALPAVVWSDQGDYNIVTLGENGLRDWLLPHIARDSASWNNRLVIANDQAMSLQIRTAERSDTAFLDAGNNTTNLDMAASADATWVRATGTVPYKAFVAFDRSDSEGGAWVGPTAIANGELGATTLYIPHVAADTENFWTGYSLANPYTLDVAVTMTAYSDEGLSLAQEAFVLPARTNDIAMIGNGRFAGVDDLSWIEIRTDRPLAGVELVGTTASDQGNLSGFLMPGSSASRLAFPLLKTTDGDWSGIALVNTGSETVSAELHFYDANGFSVRTDPIDLAPGQKTLATAPTNAAHAVAIGADLVGFCLVGNQDGRLGGYLGMGY